MKPLSCCVIVLGLFDFFVTGQSPCPGIFDYQNDGGVVYGMIRVPSNGPVSSVTTRANFTIAARLPSTYVGKLEPIGGDQILQNYNRGNPLTYRVHFPVTSPLPRLTALQVNENVVCYGPGDVVIPNRYVSTISLQHIIFLRPGNYPFENDLGSKPNSVYDYPGNAGPEGIFTFDDNVDPPGSWISVIRPNNTRPQYDLPQTPPLQFDQTPQLEYEQTPNPPRPQFEPKPKPPRPQFEQTPTPPRPQFEQTPATPEYEQPLPPRQFIQPLPVARPPQPDISSRPDSRPSFTQVECGRIAGGNERVPLIFNGQSYTRGDWPWLVAIYRRKDGSLTFICSGTLVSDRHVISAAHCMHQKSSYTSIKDIVIKIGVYNLEDWGDDAYVTRTLEAAYIHEAYNVSTLANDISVFTFDKTVEFSTFIRPACLWNGNTDLSRIVGASGVVQNGVVLAT